MTSIADIRAAKAVLCEQLLQLGLGGRVVSKTRSMSVASAMASAGRNVHAVGIGRKITEGKTEALKCVRIYVVQKLARSLMAPRDIIPAEVNGVPTDIIEAEPPFAFAAKKASSAKARRPRISTAATSVVPCSQNRRKSHRPIVAGISAGHRDITAGTLGCFCKSKKSSDDTAQWFVLSNNHVFANVNHGLIGDPLYQPGPADGGGFSDFFAALHRHVPIALGGVVANRVDAAIGKINKDIQFKTEICSIGSVSGIITGEDQMLVRKHGRTTGLTEGQIDDEDYSGLVGLDYGDPNIVALFENQLRVVAVPSDVPFGLGGDSGSVLVHKTDAKVVGLYFAGPQSGNYGLANRIEHVVSDLEISIP